MSRKPRNRSRTVLRAMLVGLLFLGLSRTGRAQVFPFTSGPIPPCDTSTFTATVSGVGGLITPNGWNWGPYLDNVVLDITTDHPQTLQISLTSPAGTTLLLSAFNGAGGQNYTGTTFPYYGAADITTASAPFTGWYSPQGGTLDLFTGENADGVWTITVVDTACATGGPGPGGSWSPGWFNGGMGSGAFAFGFSGPPPPCIIDMGGSAATICPGQTADVLSVFQNMWGSGMGVTFNVWESWTGSIIMDPYAVTSEGLYQVEGMDWSGCIYTGIFTVQLSPGVLLGPDQTASICAGSSTDLTAFFPGSASTGVWSVAGSVITPPTVAASAAVYSYSVTSVDGCVDTALVSLVVEAPPPLGEDTVLSFCSGTTVDLTTLYTTDGLNVAWTFMGVPVANPFAVQQAGTYQLMATTALGCADTVQVLLTADLVPQLGGDLIESICEAEVTDLTTFFTTTDLTTSWTSDGVPVGDPTAVGTAGNYVLVATNAAGCSDTAALSLVVAANPVLGPDQSVSTCEGSAVDLTDLVLAASGTMTWTLSGDAVMEPTAVAEAGTYAGVITSAEGCTDEALVTVQVDPSPTLGGDQTASTCAGTAFDLTPLYTTAALVVQWTLAGTPVVDPTVVTQAGAYQLVVTNGFNCTDTAVVTYTVNTLPDLGGDLNISLCPWQSVDLGAVFPVDGQNAEYTFNGQPVSDPTAVTEEGLYTVIMTDANGCMDTATANVVPMECLCVADFTADAHCLQDPVQFTLVADSAVVGARWDFNGDAGSSNAIDPQVLFFGGHEEVLVTLEATLSCGVITVQRTIRVPDCSDSCKVFVPSTFTPNGDSVNDVWSWVGECEPSDLEVTVFDRWGEAVFTSTDPRKPWDGSTSGGAAPDGVYVYRMGYRLPYQDHQEVRGTVVLLR